VFRTSDGTVVGVAIEAGPAPTIGAATALFNDTYYRGDVLHRDYDVAPDGRLLMLTGDDTPVSPIHVVLNWSRELASRVPLP